MRKLIFVLLAFLAVFTYIRAIDAEAGEIPQGTTIEAQNTESVSLVIPVEIIQ